MIIEAFQKQYTKSLSIMENVISNYDNELWNNKMNYKSPAWVIGYHALFCTNMYCAASESDIVHWEKEKKDYQRFDKIHEMRKSGIEIIPYSKDDLLEFLKLIVETIPKYLEKFEPEKKCWPYWYDENQMEFHINNFRHLQHHIGEMIERHDIVKNFEYKWK
jgi:hypothetical protein